MEVSGQLHARPLYPQGKSPWYLLDRRLDGPQSRSGRGGEEKNSQLRRESNPSTALIIKNKADKIYLLIDVAMLIG
jgi:hypothetical protein